MLMSAPTRNDLTHEDYLAGVLARERAMLAQAITLIESSKPEHQVAAQRLLQDLLPYVGGSHRIGITGVPGVGKSTTIDQLGTNLTAQGYRVSVLAVDPTSSRTGGSILGDKTRMTRLSTDRQAFVRPSPTAGTLGGVAKKTRETMAVCEAAGFDIVIVETVGVGQSETAVAEMVDFFLVLTLPGAGDELQGIKKGVLELADMIAVNKADGGNIARANRAAAEYRGALNIISPQSPSWSPPVITMSALENTGLEEIWERIKEHRKVLTATGEFQERRKSQAVKWMYEMLEDQLIATLMTKNDVAEQLPVLEAQVREGELTPAIAVARILQLFGLKGHGV